MLRPQNPLFFGQTYGGASGGLSKLSVETGTGTVATGEQLELACGDIRYEPGLDCHVQPQMQTDGR
jgi:hypothetical protein